MNLDVSCSPAKTGDQLETVFDGGNFAKYPLSEEAMSNGDVAENGKIDIYDAIEIAKAIIAG